MPTYPKRLIEVDLPIKRISAHARREKSIRHGHISTLHIWWARRPLAACRAVICAALWPDPADENCPPAFRDAAAKIILDFARKVINDTKLANDHCSPENFKVWSKLVAQTLTPALSLSKRERENRSQRTDKSNAPTRKDAANVSPSPGGEGRGEGGCSTDYVWLRSALLDFIADFANWDSSTVREYLDTSRALTAVAHAALSDPKFTLPPNCDTPSSILHHLSSHPRPLVVDPFAGGGSIPLEALRVGADAFASDLNPVPVLLNKVVLEYIPKYGQRLADEVRKWGEWIKREAEKELAEFYPKDADGATPIAYLWARTIQCEGPGCGAEVPLIRSLLLAKKANRSVALQFIPNRKSKRVDLEIIIKQRDGWVKQADPNAKIENPQFDGTLKRSSATCPCCGYTTPAERVRAQFKGKNGGADSATLLAVVLKISGQTGRQFRLAAKSDYQAFNAAKSRLEKFKAEHVGQPTLIPEEELPYLRSIFNIQLLDVTQWGQLFSSRQMLVMVILVRLIREAGQQLAKTEERELAAAVQTLLAFMLGKQADLGNSLCRWEPVAECPRQLFGRQAIGIIWDFAEGVVTGDSSGGWIIQVERLEHVLKSLLSNWTTTGDVAQSSATKHPLADDSVQAVVTDPPYYDAVPYADLSDFFYVWLKRALPGIHGDLFAEELSPKREEAVQLAERNPKYAYKTKQHFETQMLKALSEARRITQPQGLCVIVFAHKTTAAWETMLNAVIEAGWIVQASWPIDTECGSRLRAQDSAVLASSIHLVCRPRENPDGAVRTDEVGDWRDVLQALPIRIHEWMPRLAEEGVVGADAIFACLGPALEIFSRYSRVEKASGETVTLKEYLECVWAAVAKEALTIIFPDADTIGFEEDARLTAMWLWTLNAGSSTAENAENAENAEEKSDDDESESGGKKSKTTGFVLEYDAARKIAQGLGAHLEDLSSLVEVSGDQARLLPVGERARHLFGKEEGKGASGTGQLRKKKVPQLDLFKVLEQADLPAGQAGEGGTTFGETKVERHGETVLDRIHQSMILFAAGRSEALKRFLVEDGAGRDPRFWRLAQALSALYPSSTEEKRWVDGVLARKKGLGF